MKILSLLLIVVSLHALSVDNEILVPLNGDKVYLKIAGNGTLQVSRTKGPDFNVYYIQPIGIDGGWSMSIYDGAHPRGYEDDKLLGDMEFKIGNKVVQGKKYMGKTMKPFLLVTDKYNDRDLIQMHIAFSDIGDFDKLMNKVPTISIIKD